MKRFRLLAVAALVVAATAISCPAQLVPCSLGDDGFDVGCCNTPIPNLPNFPPIQMQAVYACIGNCTPSTPLPTGVSLGAPGFFLCDYAIANVTLNFPGGLAIGGPLLMKYATTWREFGTTAAPRQVWRFLVNGDLSLLAPAPTGVVCPVPPCALITPSLPIHYVGHVDYACDPFSTTGIQAAISLSHLPGCMSHAPFSTRPLAGAAGHPNISYHLVGPAPFVFAPIAEPQGPMVAESVRSSFLNWTPFAYQCRGEAPIQGGQITTNFSNCLCSPVLPVVGPWKHQDVHGAVCCGGTAIPFNSLPLAGTPIPTGFAAQTLGAYGGAAGTFPGNRTLTIYVGVLLYNAPCVTTSTATPVHVVTGVATSGVLTQPFQNPATLCGPTILPVPQSVVNLQNMLVLSTIATSGTALPGIGSLFASDVVWNIDLP